MRLFGKYTVRTTINIDDALLAEAARLTGVLDTAALVRVGLEALVFLKMGERLAKLGGTEKGLEAVERRRCI